MQAWGNPDCCGLDDRRVEFSALQCKGSLHAFYRGVSFWSRLYYCISVFAMILTSRASIELMQNGCEFLCEHMRMSKHKVIVMPSTSPQDSPVHGHLSFLASEEPAAMPERILSLSIYGPSAELSSPTIEAALSLMHVPSPWRLQ